MPQDTSIVEGQTGHVDIHEEIAVLYNLLEALVTASHSDGWVVTYDGATEKFTVEPPVTTSTETIQDVVAAMVVAGDNVMVIYDDATNTLTLSAGGGGGGGSGFSQEQIEDLVGSMVSGAETGLTATYNDATGKIEIVAEVTLAQKGQPSGYAELDRGASVPVAQTPPARVGWQEDLPDDGALPAGWIDASTLTGQELWWDAIEVLDGAFVTPDPDTGPILQLTNSGARAAAYRDFGPGYGDEVRVEAWWSGDHPYEGTPLIHVNEDADEFGIGVWPIADLLGSPFWSYGYAGRDPSQFDVIATQPIVGHTDGTPRLMSLRSSGGFVSLYVDDVLVIGPQAIPANLLGSTKHGIAIDINQDPSRTPNVPAVQAPFRVLLDGAAPASTAEVGRRLPLTGGTLSGPLVVERDPSEGSSTLGWASDSTPTVALRKHEDDTQPSVAFGFLIGVPAVTWGPGGSTAPDVLLFRTAGATLTLTGKILAATDATAATELVNKRTAERGDVAVTTNGAASLTLSNGGWYVHTGSGATWTLPALSGNTKRHFVIYNRGSGAVTVQRAGSDQLRSAGASVTSISVAAGSSAELVNDGTLWLVR